MQAILRGHKAQIHAAAFLRDNERLATGDADGHVVIWDLAIMRPAASWRAHERAILGLQGWGPDKFITHGRDNKLVAWKLAAEDEDALSKALPVEDVPTPRPQPWMLHLLEVNTLNFCSFAACAMHEGAASNSRDLGATSDVLIAVPNTLLSEAIDIFALPSQARVHTVKPGAENGMAMCLRLLHLGGCLTLLAAFENGFASVHRLDASSGDWTTTYRSQAHSQPVLALDVHPSLDFFLTSSADAVIAKHPIPTGQQTLAEGPPPDGDDESDVDEEIVRDVGSAPSLLSSAFKPSAATSAQATTQKAQPWAHPLKTVNTRHAGQQSLRVRSDGKIFATAGWDATVRVYSCKTLRELAVLQWHKVGAYAVAFADVGQVPAETPPPSGDASRGHSTPGKTDAVVASGNGSRNSSRGGALVGVKERRIRQAREVHWIAAGAKDGKSGLAQFSANATLLDTSKGDAGVSVLAAVDPDHAGLDLGGDAMSTLEVLGEDGGAKAVRRVVGPADGLCFVAEPADDDNGAEDFLLEDAHLVLDLGEDGRLDEEALGVDVERLATGNNLGALGLADLDVVQHPLVLSLGYLRALVRLGVPLVADTADRLGGLRKLLDELVVDAVLDQDAGGGGADLALVGHDAQVRPLDGLLEVTIVKDKQRRLAARL
ncbi:WD40 repeat-like domain-containingprotein [Purpureocillium lavendulum]|uniref:ASTRA-associated protein 1 n=1 Tax=Purpureocillium lavendulum TaxID=1247861 RepID=A0AB34FXX3_9HYPO|nr:WD40 repeat-like domain-containingprotein [Purpureocillium lavendulum]